MNRYPRIFFAASVAFVCLLFVVLYLQAIVTSPSRVFWTRYQRYDQQKDSDLSPLEVTEDANVLDIKSLDSSDIHRDPNGDQLIDTDLDKKNSEPYSFSQNGGGLSGSKVETRNSGELNQQQVEDKNSDKTQSDDDDYADENEKEEAEEEERLRQSPYIYHEGEEKPNVTVTQGSTKYRISFYLPWDLDSHLQNRLDACPYNCEFVNNMSKADAVLFKASAVRDHPIPPFYRPPGQRWVLFTGDPAAKNYHLSRDDVGSNFNWTMTYQQRADIHLFFGMLEKRPLPDKDYEKLFESKKKNVAWFVSHCTTAGKREDYIAIMKRYIDIDVFGGCGNLSCGPVHFRSEDKEVCLPMLTKHYKFYLSFENSLCKDYVSEKFFKLFMDVDVIPVVRGGFDYKRYLPSGIFVDASDFESPAALAKYLLKLGNDKDAYVRILKRKNRWILSESVTQRGPRACSVCEALHTADDKIIHYYKNLTEAFNGNPPDCRAPTDIVD